MKRLIHASLLGAAAMAVCLTSHGGVYSQNGISPLPHKPDEICLWTWSYGTNTFIQWYVSTNILAQQPRWDGFSTESPLNIGQACTLALKHAVAEHPEVQSWAVNEVQLKHPYCVEETAWKTNAWYYYVTLEPRDAKFRHRLGEFGTWPTLYSVQMVLLDGTVVPPTIGKPK